MPRIPAIPTIYKGIEFRSRLEAKWAIMFDQLDWSWEYEPIDLHGYIPDFILKFDGGHMLCEVKPETNIESLRSAAPKIEKSGWEGESVIVGASINTDAICYPKIGLMNDKAYFHTEDEHQSGVTSKVTYWWEAALLHHCSICGKFGLHHNLGVWTCRTCGQGDGDHHLNPVDGDSLETAWNVATNAVKYRHHKR